MEYLVFRDLLLPRFFLPNLHCDLIQLSFPLAATFILALETRPGYTLNDATDENLDCICGP